MNQKRTEYCNYCKKETLHDEVKGLENDTNGVIETYYKCENCDISYTYIYTTKSLQYCPNCKDFTVQEVEKVKEVEWTNFIFTCECGHVEKEKDLHPLQSIEEIINECLKNEA